MGFNDWASSDSEIPYYTYMPYVDLDDPLTLHFLRVPELGRSMGSTNSPGAGTHWWTWTAQQLRDAYITQMWTALLNPVADVDPLIIPFVNGLDWNQEGFRVGEVVVEFTELPSGITRYLSQTGGMDACVGLGYFTFITGPFGAPVATGKEYISFQRQVFKIPIGSVVCSGFSLILPHGGSGICKVFQPSQRNNATLSSTTFLGSSAVTPVNPSRLDPSTITVPDQFPY